MKRKKLIWPGRGEAVARQNRSWSRRNGWVLSIKPGEPQRYIPDPARAADPHQSEDPTTLA